GKVEVGSKRALPALGRLPPQAPWRVIAYTREGQEPRIVERGAQEEGGYVALWLDDPASFRGRLGERVPRVEEVRGRLEERVFGWARALMERRYGRSLEPRRNAGPALRP